MSQPGAVFRSPPSRPRLYAESPGAPTAAFDVRVLESVYLGSTRLSPSVICHLPLAICYLPFAICHLLFAICYLPSAICHLPFVIVICHLPSSRPRRRSASRFGHLHSSHIFQRLGQVIVLEIDATGADLGLGLDDLHLDSQDHLLAGAEPGDVR